MSNNKILYDKNGNIIGEQDVTKGLKQIIEHHMNKFSKRLDVFTALVSIEDKDENEQNEEIRGKME